MSRTHSVAVACAVLGLAVLTGCAARQTPETPDSAAAARASAPAPTAAGGQLQVYVRAQEALAGDNFNDAKAALDALAGVTDAMAAPLARAAAGADDITMMRERFKPLSEFVAALDLPQGFARAYCPMYDGGSNWVQRDGPIRNPYYGSGMLTCGVVDAAPGAHMDHTPRHGGTVFMAPDSFHHIEGAYPAPGIFRLHATDNYREPVDMSGWSGRVVLEEAYDEATDEFSEVRAVELVPSPDAEFLEAVFRDMPFPAEVTAKVVFVEDFPEERFDFIFVEYSTEETVDAAGSRGALPTTGAPETVPLAERISPRIPENTSEIVTGIRERNQTLEALIGRGAFTEIFIPALQSKALALELHDRAEALPTRQRNDLRIAIRHLVRAAWLLDWYGDLGNKQQVGGAYDVFAGAVADILQVYEAAR
jgi:hypothetical protein